ERLGRGGAPAPVRPVARGGPRGHVTVAIPQARHHPGAVPRRCGRDLRDVAAADVKIHHRVLVRRGVTAPRARPPVRRSEVKKTNAAQPHALSLRLLGSPPRELGKAEEPAPKTKLSGIDSTLGLLRCVDPISRRFYEYQTHHEVPGGPRGCAASRRCRWPTKTRTRAPSTCAHRTARRGGRSAAGGAGCQRRNRE